MAQRLQFSNIQNSRIPVALNVCPDDERLKQWFNEAEEMTLNQGRWWGSLWEFNACTTTGCFTTPMEVDTVEQMNVDGSSIAMANGFWGFTRLVGDKSAWWSNWGLAGGGWPAGACRNAGAGCGMPPVARQKETTGCTFATTRAGNVIRTYPTNPADVGKTITFQGNDSNNIWVRTTVAGQWIDGERVTLALPYVDTTTRWGAGQPVAVYRDATVQRVLVYSHDVDANSDLAIAIYQPHETQPTYRQIWVPGLERLRGCCVTGGLVKTVTCLVSLRHVDVATSNDWIVLQNIPAYKAAMVAVKAKEEGDYAKFNFEFYGTQASGRNARGVERVVNRGGAIPLLQAELRKKTSDRVSTAVYTDPTMTFQRQMAGFR